MNGVDLKVGNQYLVHLGISQDCFLQDLVLKQIVKEISTGTTVLLLSAISMFRTKEVRTVIMQRV